MQLYHCFDARSFRALWALEEIGLEYELIVLPFPPRAAAKQYLEINPLGTVPLLIDDTTRMTESAAICEYLARRYANDRLGMDENNPGFGEYLNWLHFGEATLTFPQTLILRYSKLEPDARKSPQVEDDYTRWFVGRLAQVERSLDGGKEYLLGDRFTVADISVGYALLLAGHLKLSKNFGPLTATYWLRLQQRGGYKSARLAQKGKQET